MNGYTYNYPNSYGPGDAIGGIFAGCYGLFWLAFAILMVVGLWKVFEKAGRPGWAAIIPIYNYIVLLEIVGRPVWWVLGLFVPFLNFVVLIVLMLDVARSFGKGTGFAIGLIFLPFVFIPMLGFGSSQYFGPASGGTGYYPPAGGGYYPPQPGQPGYPPAQGGYQPTGYAPSGQPYQPPAPPAPPAYAPPAPPVPPAYAPPAPPAPETFAPPAPPVPPAPAAPEYTPPAPPVEPAPPAPPAAPVEEPAPAAEPEAPSGPPSTPDL